MPNVAKPVAVLFDVDETLVHTGGSGARSWKAAFDQLYGIPADIGAHSSAGETDPQVARATFSGVLGRQPSDEELPAQAHDIAHNQRRSAAAALPVRQLVELASARGQTVPLLAK